MTPQQNGICPNCFQHKVKDHPESGCVLAAMIDCIRDREVMSEEKLLKLHASCDATQFWEDIGPIIDRLEAGHYSEGEEQ